MKKIFFILIISLFFLSLAFTIKAETSCDRNVKCGGAAICDDSKCIKECKYPWDWPHCDCKPIEEGGSKCWCECNEQCAYEYCIKQNEFYGFKEDDELYIVNGRCNPDKSDPEKADSAQCCTKKETSCEDGIDNDCDDKIDCADTDCPDETICDDNKVCKNKKCVEKVSVTICPSDLDCQQMTYACLCGAKETEVASGEFCFTPLSKKYELKADCDIDKDKGGICSGDCSLISTACYCGSRLISTGFCFNNRVYNTEEACKAAKKAIEEGVKPPSAWIFTCPEKGITCPDDAFCIDNPLCAESFEQLINAIINFIFYFALAIAPIMFIIAGLLFVFAAGVPEKIQKAKNVVLWTVVGLAIIIMAKGIITAIQGIFGG